jgi:hypothetical protein
MWNLQPTSGGRRESLGAVTASTTGTTITAGSSAAKGSWVSLGTTTFEWNWLRAYVFTMSSGQDYTFDIHFSNASTAKPFLIEDLHIRSNAVSLLAFSVVVPVRVPAGATLYARSASTGNAATFRLILIGESYGPRGVKGFTRCAALFTPSTTRGVTVDAGAVAHTKGSWTSISSGIDAHIGGLIAMFGTAGDAARVTAQFLVDIDTGTGSSSPLIPNMAAETESSVDLPIPPAHGPFFVNIAPNTAFVGRCQASTTTAGDRTVDICLYGLVP